MTTRRVFTYIFALILFATIALLGKGGGASVSAAPEAAAVTAIYALAFDNEPGLPGDLAPKLPAALSSIAAATSPDRTAVVLIDTGDSADTRIVVFENGTRTEIEGLPNADGLLRRAIVEYNMADGAALGGYLIWALTNYPADLVTFHIVGHGAPLVPETNLAAALDLGGDSAPIDPNPNDDFLPPLPIHVDTNNALTDATSLDILSPVDIATALQAASDAGLQNIDVVDLVHCFSSSMEELYEVSAVADLGGASYALSVVASPNYTFFDPPMLGAALSQLSSALSYQDAAIAIATAYDDHIARIDDDNGQVDHPRVISAVDTTALLTVKPAWDHVAYYLLDDFATGKQAVWNAYSAVGTTKYDTSFCPPGDFALAAPDALVDIGHFARALSNQYPAAHPVAVWTDETLVRLNTAELVVLEESGSPWFAESPQPDWLFVRNAGIGLYADFAGAVLPPDNMTTLQWQAHWYSAETFVGPSGTGNAQPYAFVQGGFDGAVWQASGAGSSWADVFQAFWADELAGDDLQIGTSACLPPFPEVLKGQIFAPVVARP